MRYAVGNIFGFPGAVCVPTNVGWKTNGENVMGRGLAKQVAVTYPELPMLYGRYCRAHPRRPYPVAVFYLRKGTETRPVICVPVKPLADPPWLSWKQPADMGVIEESLRDLVFLASDIETEQILVVRFGCGNGGQSWADVGPLMEKYLDDRFLLATQD